MEEQFLSSGFFKRDPKVPAFRAPWPAGALARREASALQRNATKYASTRSAGAPYRVPASAKTGTRTQDLRITNALLYQLSYLGVAVRIHKSA